MKNARTPTPEPWLRDTLRNLPVVPTAVLYSLQLAEEDLQHWCAGLTEAEIHTRPAGLPSIAFQLRHIAGSLDRLLTYAEGQSLEEAQWKALASEHAMEGTPAEILGELRNAFTASADRVRALALADMQELRYVGSKKLLTTLGGLLVHIAEHTQRHVGQAITTVKVVLSARLS